jgi:flagellar hook assembly protein FlgD
MTKKIMGGLLVLFLLSMLVACNGESTSPASPSLTLNPTPAPGPERGIRSNRVPDVIASYGEKAEINLSFTNEASEPRTINPFPPGISIIELPDVKPPGILVQAFPAGNSELVLQPGESASHSVEWDQKNGGGEQVPPGWYSVEVTLNTSRGSATRVLVLPSEGVMEKTIEVNQSETVNGITITLERVELTATGMKVYAFNIPPDYNLPQGPMLAPPQFMALHAEAEYSVDGGAAKQTFPSGIRFLDNGMEHSWDEYLDPVPQNSHELTFRITKLGDWEGPWEFEIPLVSGLPFEAKLNTAEDHYLPGEDILYGISIRNLSSDKISIDPFPPAMWIKPADQDEIVYSDEAGNRTQDIGTDYPDSWYHTIGVWDQKNNNGEQVPPGWYEIGYEYVIIEKNTAERYTANPTARFQIMQPDSAMNKNLEVNQSVTAEGVTVTLEHVELNAVKGTVYVFTKPPGYFMPEGHPPEQAESLMRNSRAEYGVDSGILKQPIDLRMQANESGVRLIWDLEPIPVDAKELAFVVSRLGDWIGPWEFKVKLN